MKLIICFKLQPGRATQKISGMIPAGWRPGTTTWKIGINNSPYILRSSEKSEGTMNYQLRVPRYDMKALQQKRMESTMPLYNNKTVQGMPSPQQTTTVEEQAHHWRIVEGLVM